MNEIGKLVRSLDQWSHGYEDEVPCKFCGAPFDTHDPTCTVERFLALMAAPEEPTGERWVVRRKRDGLFWQCMEDGDWDYVKDITKATLIEWSPENREAEDTDENVPVVVTIRLAEGQPGSQPGGCPSCGWVDGKHHHDCKAGEPRGDLRERLLKYLWASGDGKLRVCVFREEEQWVAVVEGQDLAAQGDTIWATLNDLGRIIDATAALARSPQAPRARRIEDANSR